MLLNERVAVITGAARGIGRSCAEVFLEAGAAGVVLLDIDVDAGKETAVSLDPSGKRVTFLATDVTSRSEVDQAVAETVKRFGRVDVLVNSAGIAGESGPLGSHSEADLDRIIAINVKSIYFTCAACHPHFVQRGFGRVVNIASIAGKEGNPGLVPYSMTKAAVIGLTKAYAKEVATDGILVNSVAPAVIETEILKQVTDEVRNYMVSKIPMGRVGQPEEVAQLVLFLSSDKMTFSTGFCYDISGGRATY